MTRKDAVEALNNGFILSHRNFFSENYVEMRNGLLFTNNGRSFNRDFKNFVFDNGWYVFGD